MKSLKDSFSAGHFTLPESPIIPLSSWRKFGEAYYEEITFLKFKRAIKRNLTFTDKYI